MPGLCFWTLKPVGRFYSNFARLSRTRRSCRTDAHSRLDRNETELLGFLSQGRTKEACNLLVLITERRKSNPVVNSTLLITKYSMIGRVNEARLLLEIMPERNVVTYNAMLTGYFHLGMISEGTKLFEEMPERNIVSWTLMMTGLLDEGMIKDAESIFEKMPERSVISWNAMVSGLVKNGEIDSAKNLFDRMPTRNIASWNAMIQGYVEHGMIEEANYLFEKMEERNIITWTCMIAGYCRMGKVKEAYRLFLSTPDKNVVCWTAMIGGFAWNSYFEDSLALFLKMTKTSETLPNLETFIALAYACAGAKLVILGKELHSHVVVHGWDDDGAPARLSKSLVHMYAELGMMGYAYRIFSCCSTARSMNSYNCMINGYIRIGCLDMAKSLFDVAPHRDKITWTSMINGYFEAGDVEEACHLFHQMPDKDSVAWTAVISGYIRNEQYAEAADIFLEMRYHGFPFLNTTCAILCAAAGSTAFLDQGRQLHSMTVKSLCNPDLILDNAFVSMYAKCGDIEDAWKIFSNMTDRDLISWNAMIMGFSHHGQAEAALDAFLRLLQSGLRPNSVTFLGVISACAHVGLVARGWQLFHEMKSVFSIQPTLEHCISMVHLLGRAGKLEEAEEFISTLPFSRNQTIWSALLGLCWFGDRNASDAKRIAWRVLELDPENVIALVLLANIFASSGEYNEEHRLRKEMARIGVKKAPGCSWIQHNGRVQSFTSMDEMVSF